MNLLKEIAVWGLVFCAVAISPVILIYSVPLGIGIVSDLVQVGAGPVVSLLCVSVLLLWAIRPVRASRAV